MPKQPSISNLAARNACDEITALLDLGPTDRGFVRIYDGVQPASVDTPITTQNLLAELELSNPAFDAAQDGTPGGQALANTITDDSGANASGTATWFRCVNKAGTGVIDGSVGVADADMLVDSVDVVAGQTVQVVAFKYRVRET